MRISRISSWNWNGQMIDPNTGEPLRWVIKNYVIGFLKTVLKPEGTFKLYYRPTKPGESLIRIGPDFNTLEEAKAAAKEHYKANYKG